MKKGKLKIQVMGILLCGIIIGSGCGRTSTPDPETLADPELTFEEAESLVRSSRSSAGRAVQRFAPEFLLAATWHEEQARQLRTTGAEDAARAELVEAAALLRNAEAVAEAIRGRRTLAFPSNRSLGNLSVKSWEPNAMWREAGPAQGNVSIEPEQIVQLGLNPEFRREDLDFIAAMGPGAVQFLSLSDRDIQDQDLETLSNIIGLRDLSLHGAPISDAGMVHLSALKTLRHLNLMGTRVTDAGIEALGMMPALEEIALGETDVTERVILTLNAFPSLRALLFSAQRIE